MTIAIKTSKTAQRTSRRAFLQLMGAGIGVLPVLEGQRADAALPVIKRLVTFFWANGYPMDAFFPSATATGLEMTPVLKGLEPVKDYTTVVAALDLDCVLESGGGVYNSHAANPGVLTGKKFDRYVGGDDGGGAAGGPSVDQFIGAELANKYQLATGCLVVGCQGGSGSVGAISYRDAGNTGIAPEKDPVQLFKNLFGGRALPEGTVDKLLVKRKSVLDVVGKQTEAFASGLATADKLAVQAHLQSIREIERQLSAVPSVACTNPEQPGGGLMTNDNTPAWYKAQADIMLAALRCDLTRVITYQFSDSYGGLTFSWLGSEFVGTDDLQGRDNIPGRDHHGLAHHETFSSDTYERFVKCNTWFNEQVAYLARGMQSTLEGSGNMLDNSLVMVASNCSNNHVVNKLPYVLIGKAGGYLKNTGRLVRVGAMARETGKYWSVDKADVSNARLLLNVCHAMDVMVDDFGDSRGQGPLTELSS